MYKKLGLLVWITGILNKRIKHRDPVLNEYFASVGTVDNGSIPGSTKSQPRMVLDIIVFDTRNIIVA